MVTFHGGMAAIGYEWGSYNHMRPHEKSPDDNLNKMIANSMSRYGGGFRKEKLYRSGKSVYNLDMNSELTVILYV